MSLNVKAQRLDRGWASLLPTGDQNVDGLKEELRNTDVPASPVAGGLRKLMNFMDGLLYWHLCQELP